MTIAFFAQPIFAGLSVGAFCLSYCFPFLAAFTVSEDRGAKKNLGLILRFIFGRFLGYMTFGLIAGYLGQKFPYAYLTLITDFSLILISIILILCLAGLFRQREGACFARKIQNPGAVAMGFLMGVNVCPPFLLSLAYVFSLHDTLQGLVYFMLFFLASSVYFLPMIFVGMLAKIRELQTVARWSGRVSACIFIIYGSYSIINNLMGKS